MKKIKVTAILYISIVIIFLIGIDSISIEAVEPTYC